MKTLLLSFFSLLIVFTVSVPAFALAQAGSSGFGGPTGSSGPGAPTGSSGTGGTFTLQDPLGIKNFCDLVRSLLNVVMAIGVPVAVLFLVWSGFRFILARGSQTGLDDAKKNFKFVIIGIAIFLGAWTFATVIAATIQTLDSSGTVQFCGR